MRRIQHLGTAADAWAQPIGRSLSSTAGLGSMPRPRCSSREPTSSRRSSGSSSMPAEPRLADRRRANNAPADGYDADSSPRRSHSSSRCSPARSRSCSGGMPGRRLREPPPRRRAAEIEALVGRIAALRSTQRDEAAALSRSRRFGSPTRRGSRSASAVDVHTESGVSRFAPAATGLRSYFGIVLPDGVHASVTTRDHRIRAYNLDTGDLGTPWDPMTNTELRFSQLYASHDSRLLAQIGDDYGTTGRYGVTIGMFDIASRTLRFPAIDVADDSRIRDVQSRRQAARRVRR